VEERMNMKLMEKSRSMLNVARLEFNIGVLI
jgi:hypothetical protein